MDEKAAAEALIPQFKFERLLNQDQNGRRINILGSISSKPALLTAERAAFPSKPETVAAFLQTISAVENLGANDIYHWYLASVQQTPEEGETESSTPIPSLKLNLIYPCTQKHVSKYSSQHLRVVTESPFVYQNYVLPLIRRERTSGRLDWIFNIIEGRTEQENIVIRSHSTPTGSLMELDEEGFLLCPDLNWDQKTMSGLHLLALVERRDIWSLRDLKKKHISWLKTMREKILDATVKVYGSHGVERDMLKLYVHYQPTYYHFHIHVVNVMLEASGHTQSTGKAFGLENLISQIESMNSANTGSPDNARGDRTILEDNIESVDDGEVGMQNIDLTYFIGEESDLWKQVFSPLKQGELKGQ